METTKRQHPSVLFQNGEVKDFYTAMEVYIDQYQEELRIGREIYREYAHEHDPEYRAKWQVELQEQAQGVEHIGKMVFEARKIYFEVMQDAKRQIAEKMRERNDHTLNEIADAVESGDWSSLAV